MAIPTTKVDDDIPVGNVADLVRGMKASERASPEAAPAISPAAVKKAGMGLVDTKIVGGAKGKPKARMVQATFTVLPETLTLLDAVERRLMLKGQKTNRSALLRLAAELLARMSDDELLADMQAE